MKRVTKAGAKQECHEFQLSNVTERISYMDMLLAKFI
jgi:hypothetical protein